MSMTRKARERRLERERPRGRRSRTARQSSSIETEIVEIVLQSALIGDDADAKPKEHVLTERHRCLTGEELTRQLSRVGLGSQPKGQRRARKAVHLDVRACVGCPKKLIPRKLTIVKTLPKVN